jgi:hypothetical protein
MTQQPTTHEADPGEAGNPTMLSTMVQSGVTGIMEYRLTVSMKIRRLSERIYLEYSMICEVEFLEIQIGSSFSARD